MTEIKMYRVEFNQYTNACNNTVSNDADDINMPKYITVPIGGLLIREDEFEIYRKYGNGFKNLTYVGGILDAKK